MHQCPGLLWYLWYLPVMRTMGMQRKVTMGSPGLQLETGGLRKGWVGEL